MLTMEKKTDDKREEIDIQKEFKKIYDKAISLGLTPEDFNQLDAIKEIKDSIYETERKIVKYILIAIAGSLGVLYGLFFAYLLDWPIGRENMLRVWFGLNGLELAHEDCVFRMPEFSVDLFRPPVECGFCQDLYQVDRVTKISPADFEEKYAYTGVPVIIEDGTVNWTAPEIFSFDFFRELYSEGSQALENHERNCQFFPYKTSFNDLGEVMQMSPERAKMEDGSEPWYIGWSNCDFSAANTLRKHYNRPYFLPELSESSKTDWIFMGSPGYGAHMHIDNVENPSWQAQIAGTKNWTLEPPPECYYVCPDRIEVTVKPGNIISGICPSDYISNNNTCYRFSHDKQAWVNAEYLCTEFDSHLVEIETANEDAFLSEEVKRLNVPFWVGANDIRLKGEWMWWTQRKKITGYSNWYPGTPDNVNGDENCMLLIYDGNSNSVFWNDGTCHMPLNYICETEDTLVCCK